MSNIKSEWGTDMSDHNVRCFRRRNKGLLRHGIWIMTSKSGYRGMFIHGDYDDLEAPKYTVEELSSSVGGFVDEISPDEVLQELASWPEAVDVAQQCFDRHIVQAGDLATGVVYTVDSNLPADKRDFVGDREKYNDNHPPASGDRVSD